MKSPICKHSQVTFMPYGVVLKDERPTSNIQHRMKKQTPDTEHSTIISVSCEISFSSSGFLISGTRRISLNHLWVSLSSFNEILALVFVFHSTFDVGRSMFDVHFFSPSWTKTT